MSKIEIKPVTTRKELQQFVQFYYDLYRDCKYAVPFLYSEEMSTLREDKNTSFECCEAQYFMAFRYDKLVGRVAAIINRRANERWDRKQVRFSWFDFIDDQEVSAALLKTVEDWGRQKGMTSVSSIPTVKVCSSTVSTSSPPCTSTTITLTIRSTWNSWQATRKPTTG